MSKPYRLFEKEYKDRTVLKIVDEDGDTVIDLEEDTLRIRIIYKSFLRNSFEIMLSFLVNGYNKTVENERDDFLETLEKLNEKPAVKIYG